MVTKGMKRLHFPDDRVEVQPGNIILLRKGIYMMAEYVEEGMDFEAIMLVLDGNILRSLAAQSPLSPAQSPLNPAQSPLSPAQAGTNPYWLISTSDLVDDLKGQLKGYFGKPLLDPKALLSLKQQELLLLLQSAGHTTQVSSFLRSALSEAPEDLDYIVRKNLFQPLSIEDLAGLTNRSLASFKRDFQRIYGEAPRRWINRERLAHAKVLVSNTNQTVSEIATECGFKSTSYFIRIFREAFGVTPAADRATK
jgi:AraC-like DNA-binding protein